MKKKTTTIGALLLAMTSFGQTDTLAFSVSGKEKYEFDYYSSEVVKTTKPENYQDFKFKLKKDEILYIDLFDYLERDTLYLMYRDITVYYRGGDVKKLYFNSEDNTLKFYGDLVKRVIVHKPEKISENLVLE